jgi:hypothetical protein
LVYLDFSSNELIRLRYDDSNGKQTTPNIGKVSTLVKFNFDTKMHMGRVDSLLQDTKTMLVLIKDTFILQIFNKIDFKNHLLEVEQFNGRIIKAFENAITNNLHVITENGVIYI